MSSFLFTREEDEDIVLIPVTPNEKVKGVDKDMTASPKPSKSLTTSGKSPKDSNKSNLTQDLRKMTPNGKPLMKIVKSPKQMILVSPKKNSPFKKHNKVQDESPGIRNRAKNVAKQLATDVRSPRKNTVTANCDSPIKTIASPAKNQLMNVAKQLKVSVRRSPRKNNLIEKSDSPTKSIWPPAANQVKDNNKELENGARKSPRKNSLTGKCYSPRKTILSPVKNQVKNMDKNPEIAVGSPRKNGVPGKCISPLKTVSLPANTCTSFVARAENDSKKVKETSDDSKMLSREETAQYQTSGETRELKKYDKMTHGRVSKANEELFVKTIAKSPLRTMKSSRNMKPWRMGQNSPKSADNAIDSNSPSKLNTNLYVAEYQPVIKEQPKPLRKSPRKSVQNQNTKHLSAPLSCEKTHMAYKSPIKQELKAASPGKSSTKKKLQSPRNSPTKGFSTSNKARKNINYDIGDMVTNDQSEDSIKTGMVDAKVVSKDDIPVDQLSNNPEQLANVGKNQSKENLGNLEEPTVDTDKVSDSYVSEESDDDAPDTNHHETDQSEIESIDAEVETDSPKKKSDLKNMVVTAHEKVADHLGLGKLIELGAKKAENPTSSDDFERCIMIAISQGELCHRQIPDYIESDRVLRSNRSLDLDEVDHVEAQAGNLVDSVPKNISSELGKAASLKLDCHKENIVSKAIHDKGATVSDSDEQAFTLTDKEIKLFSQPPENKEKGEFELPLELYHEVFFTPTLAERVKSRFRHHSPSSYNLSSPVRSRSNSISSNTSETSATRRINTAATKVNLHKAKTLLRKHVKSQKLNQNPANNQSSSQNSDSSVLKLKSDSNENHQNMCSSEKLTNVALVNMQKHPVQDLRAEIKNGIKKNRKNKKFKKISCVNKKTKTNTELQSLKDTWNDLSSPSLERSSRNQRKIQQSYNDSSELTEDYEYDQDQSDSGAQSQDQIVNSDNKRKKNKESDKLNLGIRSTKHSVKSLDSIENLQQKSLNGVDLVRDEALNAEQRLDTDTLNKMNNDNVDTCMKEGRNSPVFNSSPVSKRRKGQADSAVSNAANKKVDKENSEIMPLSERVLNKAVENAEVSTRNSTGEKEGSRLKGSDCKHKIKISKAIRNSFIENSPSDSDVVIEVSSTELDESKEHIKDIENAVFKSIPEQSTPDSKKKVPSGCYGSGYSATPRSERRKAWKRKKIAGKIEDTNAKKRRKLDKLKFVIHENQSSINALSVNDLEKTELKTKVRKKKQNSSGEMDQSLEKDRINNKNENCLSGQKDRITSASDNRNEKNKELNESFSLQWKSVVDKVKLNKSWSLLSSRSVNKLLSSEDGRESFDGFTEKDITGGTSLESDMSYEDCSEVDKSINSEKEFVIDLVEKEEKEDNNKAEFGNFLPVFSSPGKKSDSSWFDACEDYIDHTVKNTVEPLSVVKGWTSPRKASLGTKEIAEMYKSPTKSPKTSRRKLATERSASNAAEDRQQVDMEIEFNFGSPLKNFQEFSPRGMKKGRAIGSPSPKRKTSTPTRRIKFGKDK